MAAKTEGYGKPPSELLEPVQALWKKATEWEGIPADSKFVVFSENNPHLPAYNEALGKLLRFKQFERGEFQPATYHYGSRVAMKDFPSKEEAACWVDEYMKKFGTDAEQKRVSRIWPAGRRYTAGIYIKEPKYQPQVYQFFPEEVRKKLPKLYSQENVKDPTVWVKFFTPWTNWTWYGIEFDGKDSFFGWVVGLEKELGYFSLSELQSISGPVGLRIERDIYFEPKPLSEVQREHQLYHGQTEEKEKGWKDFYKGNRVQASIDSTNYRIEHRQVPEEQLIALHKSLKTDWKELVEYQKLQSWAFAGGKLTQDEALQLFKIYGGDNPSPEKWDKLSIAEKVAGTRFAEELLRMRAREGGYSLQTEAYVQKLPRCDFCSLLALYDARTRRGPWAYMCEEHFREHGVGLGTGKGQRLKPRQALGEAEEIRQKLEGAAMPGEKEKAAVMSEEQLQESVLEGVWHPVCPYCGAETPAEPDATYVYCEACSRRFKIINPYFQTIPISAQTELLSDDDIRYERQPIPFTAVKRLTRDDILYVTKDIIPHPLKGYSDAHEKWGVVDIRGFRKGYEPRLEIQGTYTPNSDDVFRIEEGHLPPYQPTVRGDRLLEELRKRNQHKAYRVRPRPATFRPGAPDEEILEELKMWEEHEKLAEQNPKTIPIESAPKPRKEGDLEYLADSPEFVAQTIDNSGWRQKLDQEFKTAIERARGS